MVELEEEKEDKTKPEENAENNNSVANKEPKPVETPYYIKVNYGANVVTVYKKDKARKIYYSNKSDDLFLPEQQHQNQEYMVFQINILGDY